MTIYILIHEKDTDSAWGADAAPFLDADAARDAMRASYEAAVKAWDFDESIQTEEHECCCQSDRAILRDDADLEHWRIEAHEIGVEMAIRVKGGLVQAIYANADIYPDVYDLDVSDCPDDGEQDAAEGKEAELERISQQPGWREVW